MSARTTTCPRDHSVVPGLLRGLGEKGQRCWRCGQPFLCDSCLELHLRDCPRPDLEAPSE